MGRAQGRSLGQLWSLVVLLASGGAVWEVLVGLKPVMQVLAQQGRQNLELWSSQLLRGLTLLWVIPLCLVSLLSLLLSSIVKPWLSSGMPGPSPCSSSWPFLYPLLTIDTWCYAWLREWASWFTHPFPPHSRSVLRLIPMEETIGDMFLWNTELQNLTFLSLEFVSTCEFLNMGH